MSERPYHDFRASEGDAPIDAPNASLQRSLDALGRAMLFEHGQPAMPAAYRHALSHRRQERLVWRGSLAAGLLLLVGVGGYLIAQGLHQEHAPLRVPMADVVTPWSSRQGVEALDRVPIGDGGGDSLRAGDRLISPDEGER